MGRPQDLGWNHLSPIAGDSRASQPVPKRSKEWKIITRDETETSARRERTLGQNRRNGHKMQSKPRTHLGCQVRTVAAEEGSALDLRVLLGGGGAVAEKMLNGGNVEDGHQGGAGEPDLEWLLRAKMDSAQGRHLWWGFWR